MKVIPATATITVGSESKIFGEADSAFSATVTGLIGSDVVNYILVRVAGEQVGSYAITAIVRENPNYIVNVVNGVMTIHAAPVITPPVVENVEPPTTEPEVTPVVLPEVEVEAVVETPDNEVEEFDEEVETVKPRNDDDTLTTENTQESGFLGDGGVPLAALFGTWSLFDLIMTIVSVVLPITHLVAVKRKRDEDEEDNEEKETETQRKNRVLTSIFLFIAAIASVIFLLVTQDFTLKMSIFDIYSIGFAIIVLVQVILMITRRRKTEEKKLEESKA